MKKSSMLLIGGLLFVLLSLGLSACRVAKHTDPFSKCYAGAYDTCGNPWVGGNYQEKMVCLDEVYDACRCDHRPDLAKLYNKNKNCSEVLS